MKELDATECVRDVMTKVWRAAALVTSFFRGDATKAQMWLEAPNPLLGNYSPLRMLELGRLEKLVEFIAQQIAANKMPLREEQQAGMMRAKQPGWVQLGKTGDRSGRRQLWVRILDEGGTRLPSVELCAGREGDDAYAMLGQYNTRIETINDLVDVFTSVMYADEIDAKEPKRLVIICPVCKGQHIDRDEWATTRVHRSHLCEHCGLIWRPFEYPTVGVAGQEQQVATRELSPHEKAIVAVACPRCAAPTGELCKGKPGYVCIDRVLLVFP